MIHSEPPFILTLKFDQAAFERFDALRRQHFPPERNLIPAHLTLFHALPGDQQDMVVRTIGEQCAATQRVPLAFPRPRFLGRGVAIEVESPRLGGVRRALAEVWEPWLGAQDRQRHRAHITVQNKVAPDRARALYEQLVATWRPFEGSGEGLLLWRYLGGPWELVEEFLFAEA